MVWFSDRDAASAVGARYVVWWTDLAVPIISRDGRLCQLVVKPADDPGPQGRSHQTTYLAPTAGRRVPT